MSADGSPTAEPTRQLGRPPNPGTMRPYSCSVCSSRFTAKRSLHVHMRRHTGEKPFGCAFCPRRFRDRSSWALHERQHTDPSQLPFGCDACGWRYKLRKTLITHIREEHRCEKPHYCSAPDCLAIFVKAAARKNHEQRQHGIMSPPPAPAAPQPDAAVEVVKPDQPSQPTTCSVCDKQFLSVAAMRSHQRSHMEDNRFHCRQCPMHFGSGLSLRSHLRVHFKSAAFKCKMCSLRFPSRGSLFTHLKMHDRQQGGNLYFRCSKCLERFAGRKKLWAHLKTHRDEGRPEAGQPVENADELDAEPGAESAKDKGKAKQSYQCPMCPRVFGGYNSMMHHLKLSCPSAKAKAGKAFGKFFSCSKCGMRFKTRKQMYYHSQTHALKALKVEPVDYTAQTEATNGKGAKEAPDVSQIEISPARRFRCGKCSEPFPDRRALHAHSKVHTGAMVVLGVDPDAVDLSESTLSGDLAIDSSIKDEVAGPPRVKRARTGPKYRCVKCGNSFANSKNLRRHRRINQCMIERDLSEPQKVKGIRCRKCPEVFSDKKSQMVHHVKAHSGTQDVIVKDEPVSLAKKYRCTKCSLVFPNKNSHWSHYKEHADDLPVELLGKEGPVLPSYKCRRCEEVFQDKISHWWHFRSHLDCEKPEDTCEVQNDPLSQFFRCVECAEVFSDEASHWQHYRLHAPPQLFEIPESVEEPTKYRCGKCKEVFPDEESHWLHFKTHADIPTTEMFELVKSKNGDSDGIPTQYRCRKCPEVFEDVENHWWHYRSHSTIDMDLCDPMEDIDNPLVTQALNCSKCSELFSDERTLWWHTRSHASDLSDCVEVVCGSSAQPEYLCVKCPEAFASENAHWLHFRSHFVGEGGDLDLMPNGQAEERQEMFKCSDCPQKFADQDDLWEHFREHVADPVCLSVSLDEGPDPDGASDAASHRCVKCGQASMDLESHWWHYRSHMSGVEMEPLEVRPTDPAAPAGVRCLPCGETFPDAESHWEHYRLHLDGEVCQEAEEDTKPKMYPCSECPAVFPDKRSRFLHGTVHVTPRNGSGSAAPTAVPLIAGCGYQCNACKEIFLDTESHWWHYKTVHNPGAESVGPETYEVVELTDDPAEDSLVKRFQCSKCSQSFPSRKAHLQHYKAVHGGDASVENVQQAALSTSSGRKGYRCSKCPEVFPNRKSHWWHYRIHTNSSEPAVVEVPVDPSCDNLDLSDANPSEQDDPSDVTEKTVNRPSKVLHCSKCPEVLADRKSLFAHHKAVHGEAVVEEKPKTREFRCGKCPEVFSDRKSHWWHYRIHTDPEFSASLTEETVEPPVFKYHCSKCLEGFPDRKSHYIHYQEVHRRASSGSEIPEEQCSSPAVSGSAKKVLNCSLCPAEFNGRKKLDRHKAMHRKYSQEELKTYRCTTCSKSFRVKLNLFNHMKAHILDGKAGKTAVPNASASSKSGPRLVPGPASATTGTRSFKCSKCPARFSSRRVLAAHFKTHRPSDRMYPCTECGATFNARGHLRAHAEIHQAPAAAPLVEPKPDSEDALSRSTFPCSKCDATFSSVMALASHQRVHIHSQDKPFKCKHCGKRFVNGANRLRHMKTHRHLNSKSSRRASADAVTDEHEQPGCVEDQTGGSET